MVKPTESEQFRADRDDITTIRRYETRQNIAKICEEAEDRERYFHLLDLRIRNDARKAVRLG